MQKKLIIFLFLLIKLKFLEMGNSNHYSRKMNVLLLNNMYSRRKSIRYKKKQQNWTILIKSSSFYLLCKVILSSLLRRKVRNCLLVDYKNYTHTRSIISTEELEMTNNYNIHYLLL